MRFGTLLFFSVTLLCTGCGGQIANQFTPDVATALRRDNMRRMETDELIVYYPAHRKKVAEYIARRAETCTRALRTVAQLKDGYAAQKPIAVMPDLPLNNAFVRPEVQGQRMVSVLPIGNTLDFSAETGIPPDMAPAGCHEMVHYVQFLQFSGLLYWISELTGPLVNPQLGLDLWVAEGLATYYETRLQPGVGRMAWPVWRGYFHAAYAGKTISGGDLAVQNRAFQWGNHYLVGSHFIEFLAEKYGEEALWKVVGAQGDSIFFPLGSALRWRAGMGKGLSALIDEFSAHVAKRFPLVSRPASQKTIRAIGRQARYAISLSGREAAITMSTDEPFRLQIYDDGHQIRSRNLTDVLPPFTLVGGAPESVSGLSFTADGQSLYFVTLDRGAVRQHARLLRYDVGADDLFVVAEDINGIGGGVSGEGRLFYYTEILGDQGALSVLNLATGKRTQIKAFGQGQHVVTARPSPNGTQVAITLFDGKRFVAQVRDAKSGALVAALPAAGAVYEPRWADDANLVLLREVARKFQVFRWQLKTSKLTQLSDAPYLAFQAAVKGNAVRFLNREGLHWTIDEVALEGGTPVAAADAVVRPTVIDQPLNVISDEPYSHFDKLLVPSLRLPFYSSPSNKVYLMGLDLSGRDRLSYHNWNLLGLYDLKGGELSGGASYSTSLLAPWTLSLSAKRFAWREAVDGDEAAGALTDTRSATLSFGRAFRTWSTSLSVIGLDEREAANPTPVLRERRMVGPRLNGRFVGFETSPYAGIRRGLVVQGSLAHFAQALSTLDVDVTDASVTAAVTTPLPLSRRHTLRLSVRARRLLGTRPERALLKVGGLGAPWVSLHGVDDSFVEPDAVETGIPAGLAFYEGLRGYEDLGFYTDQIYVAGLTYRYPIILDLGFSHVGYLLPHLFLQQINFELFANGASTDLSTLDDTDRQKLAIGTSASLDFTFWLLPISVQYQLAKRFSDDEALAQTILLGLASPF